MSSPVWAVRQQTLKLKPNIKMKDFMFVFRNDPSTLADRSPEEMQASMQKWMDWIGGIAAQGKLIDRGNRLNPAGRVVKPSLAITDGPYIETKESVGGYTMVRAESLDEATEMAKGCPILLFGGNVEVREIDRM
ncbi:Uncharacterized conserved protein [Dyadobacter sp. SG02]|nr:Uncharacterized conserved protein [Dyadobacter sp. SG02]